VDSTFLVGAGAVLSSIIVFCGSVWGLLSMVMGVRLAYFVTASIALGFLLIMGVVWSISPLGPVGQLPEWNPLDIGDDPGALSFEPAADYPEGPWRTPDTADQAEATQVTELETAAADFLDQAITENQTEAFEAASDAVVASDDTRLLDQDGKLFGAVTLEAAPGNEGGPAIAVMEYDPGNALGPPRTITAGVALVFLAHLFGLSRAERKSTRRLAEVSR
jgi:hypothetical protein